MKRSHTTRKHSTGKVLIALLIIGVLFLGRAFLNSSSISGSQAKVTQSAAESADYEETMLNVGQGLSILVKSNGHYMLFDGGSRSASSYVVAYLQQHNITKLDYVIASHYDEDHIAGLIGVLNTADVDTVLCPDYTTDTQIYSSFKSAVATSGAKVVHPSVKSTYSLGNSTITVLGPASYNDRTDNNRSIAIRIDNDKFSSIITGDAEHQEEQEMLNFGINLRTNLYVAGHHGSSNSSCSDFVKAMSPAYVFISCGKDNSYGHPHWEALSIFKDNDCKIFRSDDQGEVTCFSDGDKYWFSTKPSNNWTSGSGYSVNGKPATVKQESDSNTEEYIINTSTGKFHRPTCESVSSMNPKNKKQVTTTQSELISEGYSPCSNCI